MAKTYAPTLRAGAGGFSSVGLLLQFIYRLRSPRLGRLWTKGTQVFLCVSVCLMAQARLGVCLSVWVSGPC